MGDDGGTGRRVYAFSGTRDGMTDRQLEALFSILSEWTGKLLYGNCVGADAQAHDMAQELGYEIEIFPGPSEAMSARRTASVMHPPSPFLKRNMEMVSRCCVLIAAPRTSAEVMRSGTWSSIRYARKLGRKTIILSPDGS